MSVVNLTAYLRRKSWSQRPPEASARVLALMVELWEHRVPFPTRDEIARRAGVSTPTVDLVLRRHKKGDLMIVYDGGAPVLRGKRWVVPSNEIMTCAAVGKLYTLPAAKFRQPVDKPKSAQNMGTR